MIKKASFLERVMNCLIEARERKARVDIRQHLRGLSDRHLEDMGLSRELINQGPKAWPWRAPVEPHDAPMLAAAMRGRKTEGQSQPANQSGADDKLAA